MFFVYALKYVTTGHVFQIDEQMMERLLRIFCKDSDSSEDIADAVDASSVFVQTPQAAQRPGRTRAAVCQHRTPESRPTPLPHGILADFA